MNGQVTTLTSAETTTQINTGTKLKWTQNNRSY